MFHKPQHNTQQGCPDQSKPITHTEEQLSRAYDAVHMMADLPDVTLQQAFAILPITMKMELNYSNWKYKSK